ncbi:MAG: cyclophilin-like fold protein [Pseudomonadaceae bacterium]
MRIHIVLGDQTLSATLNGSAAAKAFADQLPLELQLDDYHGIEKIADLPERLPTSGSPAGMDPDVGDITYYAPWGNLAIFYRDFGYASGLIHLGRIDGSMDDLSVKGSLLVRIERADGN